MPTAFEAVSFTCRLWNLRQGFRIVSQPKIEIRFGGGNYIRAKIKSCLERILSGMP